MRPAHEIEQETSRAYTGRSSNVTHTDSVHTLQDHCSRPLTRELNQNYETHTKMQCGDLMIITHDKCMRPANESTEATSCAYTGRSFNVTHTDFLHALADHSTCRIAVEARPKPPPKPISALTRPHIGKQKGSVWCTTSHDPGRHICARYPLAS